MFQDLIKKDRKYYNRVNNLLVPVCEYDRYNHHTKTTSLAICQMYRASEKIDTAYTFEATLCFKKFTTGRSSVGAHYHSEDGRYEFYMALTFIEEMLQLGCPLNKIHGRWSFVKRGAYTSLKLVELL